MTQPDPALIEEHKEKIFNLSIYDIEKMQNTVCVYFLKFEKEVVYVGQTINLLRRILEHIYEREKVFDEISYIDVRENDLDYIESKFIVMFNPIFNKKQGHVKKMQSCFYSVVPRIEKQEATRICAWCGKSYEGAMHGRYCSNSCKQKAYRNRKKHGNGQASKGQRTCARCGKPFEGALHGRYHSSACKQAAYRERKKYKNISKNKFTISLKKYNLTSCEAR